MHCPVSLCFSGNYIAHHHGSKYPNGARAAGETAPLIFTALFSYYYITGFGDLFYEMGSLAVLIYNFALEPYDAQNKLAWAASFILVLSILSVNIFSRILAAFTEKTKRV